MIYTGNSIEQHEPHNKVAPVALLLLQTGDQSWKGNGWDCYYDKRKISLIIYDTDIM
jgi:hypothetical protein